MIPHVNHSTIKTNALIEAPGIYPFLTGFENLKIFFKGTNQEEIQQIIQDLKMSKLIHNKAKTYSMGMKQKLGIALSFLNHPQILFLDGPMNGLDPQAIRDVRNAILKRSREGVTFFCVQPYSKWIGEIDQHPCYFVRRGYRYEDIDGKG